MLFKKKIKANRKSKIEVDVLFKNNIVDNIYAACTCCYNYSKTNIDYFKKLEYVEKRAKAGHDSILEHGSVTLLVTNIDLSKAEEIIEVTNCSVSEFLKIETKQDYDHKKYSMLVSGSIRGFKYFVNNVIKNGYEENTVASAIIHELANTIPIELFTGIKYLGTVKEFYGPFVNVEPDIDLEKCNNNNIIYPDVVSEYIDEYPKEIEKKITVGMTSNNNLAMKQALLHGFTKETVLKCIPVTVIFHNMSRTATHQVVRHRNAITQESQRYVNYSNASFTIPGSIEDTNTKKKLKSIANKNIEEYNELVKSGVRKEEARAILPSNINCGKLYMTFSLYTLYKFINLRTDVHAQHEIRMYANKIAYILLTSYNFNPNDLLDYMN